MSPWQLWSLLQTLLLIQWYTVHQPSHSSIEVKKLYISQFYTASTNVYFKRSFKILSLHSYLWIINFSAGKNQQSLWNRLNEELTQHDLKYPANVNYTKSQIFRKIKLFPNKYIDCFWKDLIVLSWISRQRTLCYHK